MKMAFTQVIEKKEKRIFFRFRIKKTLLKQIRKTLTIINDLMIFYNQLLIPLKIPVMYKKS